LEEVRKLRAELGLRKTLTELIKEGKEKIIGKDYVLEWENLMNDIIESENGEEISKEIKTELDTIKDHFYTKKID
jgi:hypothetical protein